MVSYEVVSEQKFNELENQWSHDSNSIPLKKYVAKCSDGSFLAMNNSSGECWVEQFPYKLMVEDFFANDSSYDEDYTMIEPIRHKELEY